MSASFSLPFLQVFDDDFGHIDEVRWGHTDQTRVTLPAEYGGVLIRALHIGLDADDYVRFSLQMDTSGPAWPASAMGTPVTVDVDGAIFVGATNEPWFERLPIWASDIPAYVAAFNTMVTANYRIAAKVRLGEDTGLSAIIGGRKIAAAYHGGRSVSTGYLSGQRVL